MSLDALPYLKNLNSTAVYSGYPWTFEGNVPPEVRKNKGLRDQWINTSSTEWSCWTMWEGLNERQRLGRQNLKEGGEVKEENPPLFCHGFAADYDYPHPDEAIYAGVDKMAPILPNYMCRSLSGNVHLVWLFEKPIKVGSFELAVEFLKVIADQTGVAKALTGFDGAFFQPEKYYTNGANWSACVEQRVSHALGTGWLMEAHKKVNYAEKGYHIPLNIVRDELLKKTEFIAKGWDSIDFQVGAQGPTWWIPESTSPKSAIVKESGMFTFSSHAPKDFYTWGEMIGFAFVDQYKSNLVGKAVAGIWFDGRQFWREISRGDWKSFDKPDIMHFLRVTRGLSEKVPKGDKYSEIDLAYEFIIDHQNIEGAAPFVFKPNGPITLNKKPFLNTHTARVIQPVEHAVEWGNESHFPFISTLLGPPSPVSTDESAARFFKGGVLPLDTFLSWLAHFYKSAYQLDLKSGHNLFISGPVGIGKTLLNREIVGGVMNGYREAKEYLMGEDTFGAELFSVGHWCVDDGTMSTSIAAHRRWGEMIKRMAANRTFRYHEKFRTPMQVDWQGRVGITLNTDEESARVLPDLDRSLLDKVELYRTTDTPTVNFPEQAELREIIANELPYFARYLLDWKTPDHCLLRTASGSVDYRFGGIKPWHDASLIQHANQSSRTAGFVEILSDWKQEYFKIANEGTKGAARITSWTGSAFQLRKLLCVSPATQDALRGTDNSDIGRTLSQLKAKGYPIESSDVDDIRYWTIHEGKKTVTEKPVI